MSKCRILLMPVVLCAFACVSFVHEDLTMAGTIHTPTKVVIRPASTTVVSGKDASFTATVYDQNNKKMSGDLIWSLTSPVTGCTITQKGEFKTTAGTTPLGSYTNLVQVQVRGASVSGQATVSVLQMPFTGGVFIGTRECTLNCSYGADESPLAAIAAATTFKVLTIDGSDGSAEDFSGTIDKHGDVSAVFTSSDGRKVTVTCQITFGATGYATGINGTYASVVPNDPSENNSGVITLSAVSAASGAGPKIGSWSIPKSKPPTGAVYAIFDEGGAFVASAASNKGGTLKYTDFSGTWAPGGAVDFTIAGGNNVTGGSGTCNSHATACSGELYDNATGVGKWNLRDL